MHYRNIPSRAAVMKKKPTKQQLRAFKSAHSMTNQQIANICLCSKRTVENWINEQDTKREIPALAWEKLSRYVDIQRTIDILEDELISYGLTKNEIKNSGMIIHGRIYN